MANSDSSKTKVLLAVISVIGAIAVAAINLYSSSSPDELNATPKPVSLPTPHIEVSPHIEVNPQITVTPILEARRDYQGVTSTSDLRPQQDSNSTARKYIAEIVHRVDYLEDALSSGKTEDYVLNQFTQNIDRGPVMFGELKDESFSGLLFNLRESINSQKEKDVDLLIDLHKKLIDKTSIRLACENENDVDSMRNCVQKKFLNPFKIILANE